MKKTRLDICEIATISFRPSTRRTGKGEYSGVRTPTVVVASNHVLARVVLCGDATGHNITRTGGNVRFDKNGT